MKRLAFRLGTLQAFIGIGGVAGGLRFVLDPSGAGLWMSVKWLRNSPFPDFLMPGIVLLAVNGVGSLVGAGASFFRFRYAGEIAVALGAFLMAWIIAQVYWINGFHWLQPLYFGFGMVELLLGLLLRRELVKVS